MTLAAIIASLLFDASSQVLAPAYKVTAWCRCGYRMRQKTFEYITLTAITRWLIFGHYIGFSPPHVSLQYRPMTRVLPQPTTARVRHAEVIFKSREMRR